MGMMADNNIDYSASRRRSTMVVKKIQEREERHSAMGRKTDDRKQSAMVGQPLGRLVSNLKPIHKLNFSLD